MFSLLVCERPSSVLAQKGGNSKGAEAQQPCARRRAAAQRAIARSDGDDILRCWEAGLGCSTHASHRHGVHLMGLMGPSAAVGKAAHE